MQDNKWRVIAVYKDRYKLVQNDNSVMTRVTGNFYNQAVNKSKFLTVGDWIFLNEGGLIESINRRKNQFSRKAARKKIERTILRLIGGKRLPVPALEN